MESANRIVELASRQTVAINDFLEENKLPTPSLGLNALQSPHIPDGASDIQAARELVIAACPELKALLTGPRQLLKFNVMDGLLKAILRFKLDQSFMENTPGVISHSALTAIIARDEAARNALVVELDGFWPAGVRMADAMKRWPNSEESNETGFSPENNSNKSMSDIFADNPGRSERSGRYFSKPEPVAAPDDILDHYPWFLQHNNQLQSASPGESLVSSVVQDLPNTITEGTARLPTDLRDRVNFYGTPVSADVYYFRSIFHNCADKCCIKILQSLVPALKPGARIIIHERILPGLETLTTADAKRAINLDVGMQQPLNTQQA
ncbi:hypothetical protein GQX73_g7524 [Xylaria multiplex]|uniref:O-methyltransferase C-terminal domain-containing protein n=1 Tax=Xylaria multiplex TaxID=323545 RepID=A0A7C8IKM0_9PEZI|nr:hypothetical protein GQX73_g7524 [Xylaria multiplex]